MQKGRDSGKSKIGRVRAELATPLASMHLLHDAR